MQNMQNYVSSELTHFVGRALKTDDERYNLLINIIKSGILRGKIDNGRGSTMVQIDPNLEFSGNESYNPNIVCFCDIPANDFHIHMSKYSKFGVAFSKDFLTKQGARPVCYVPKSSTYVNQNISEIFNKNVKALQIKSITESLIASANVGTKNDGIVINTDNLSLQQFLDLQLLSFIKFFDISKDDDDIDNFYMEREWRSLERIEFLVQDIQRIILPSSYIRRFFQDIPEYNSHITTV